MVDGTDGLRRPRPPGSRARDRPPDGGRSRGPSRRRAGRRTGGGGGGRGRGRPRARAALPVFGPLMAGEVAVRAGGEQVVVPGVAVADGGGNGRGQGRLFQFAAARGPADAAAAASGGMAGNLPGPFWDRESTRLN